MRPNIYAQNPLFNIADNIRGWQNVDIADQTIAANKMTAQQNALALQGKQREMAEAQQLRNALAGLNQNATDEEIAAAALGTRLPGGIKLADEIRKAAGERALKAAQTKGEETKATRDATETAVKRTGIYRDMLAGINDKQSAVQWIQAQYQDPILSKIVGAIPMEQAVARIPDDPQQFLQWRNAQGMGLDKFVQNQTTQRGQDIQSQTSRENNAATNARIAADAAANRGVTMRGQNMVDARQRDLNTITKEDREATRVAEKKDRAVTDYSKTLQKEGIPDFEEALSNLEDKLSKYKPGQTPGVGRVTGLVPDFLQGQEAEDMTNAVAAVKNTLLKARSGSAVSESELKRLVQELGTGGFRSEATVRGAVSSIRDRFEKVKANVVAGVSDDVKNEYEARGGTPITRGGAKPSAVVDVKTDEDYNALKPGTRFRTPDGKMGTKR